MKTLFAALALTALSLTACDKPADTKPAEGTATTATAPTTTAVTTAVSPTTATPVVIADSDLSTTADFEEEAEKAITAKNYKAELASLETDVSKE